MTTPPRGTGENLLPECCGRHGTSQSYYCGLCPLDEALAEYVGNPAQRRIVLDRLTTLRARAERAEGALERIRDGAGSNTIALSDVQDERAHTWGGVYQIAVKAVGERPVHLHTTSFGHITGGRP